MLLVTQVLLYWPAKIKIIGIVQVDDQIRDPSTTLRVTAPLLSLYAALSFRASRGISNEMRDPSARLRVTTLVIQRAAVESLARIKR